MASKIEQEIIVKIKTLVEGLNNVQTLSSSIKDLNKGGGASLASNFLKAGAAAGVMDAVVTKLVNGLEEAGSLGVRAFAGFVEEGIKFNASIESSKIGIATLLTNTYDVKNAQGQLVTGADAFNASLEASDEISKKIQKSAIETGYLFQDVFTFFNSALIASAGQTTNVDQLVRLTQQFALAAGAAHIEVEKVRTGIQQILTGVVTVRNPLARVLFPGETTKQINETLKSYKAAGTLVDFLEKKMQTFGLSADAVTHSFQALATNVYDAFKVFAGEATLPLFTKVKEIMALIIGQVVDLSGEAIKLTPTFQKIADFCGQILSFLGDRLIEGVKLLLGYLDTFANYLSNNSDSLAQIVVNVYAIAEQVALIAVDLLSITGDVAEANANTSNWASVTQFIALTLGFIRDILNIIVGVLEGIAGVILISISTFISYISDTLASIIQDTGGWLNALIPVATILDRIAQSVGAAGAGIANSGTDRLIGGLNFDALNSAANGVNRQLPALPPPSKKGNFSFHSRQGLNGADGGKGKKKAEQDRLQSAKQLFDQIEKYQIANAHREVELAQEVNKQLLHVWQTRYDQGLVSTEDFYKEKAKLEGDDLDRQQAELLKEQAFAKQALSRDLGAIAGNKFQLSPDELNATIAKLDALDPDKLATADTKTIKQATEYIKYLEQTAGITQKLTQIEQKRAADQTDNTEAIEKATRANKTLKDSLGAEFASSQGNDALKDLLDLQKRISDEFPKILTETNKGLPGIEQFATAIRNAAEVDTTGITTFLQEAGIDFNSLSEEARVFFRLMERLEGLAKLKVIQNQVDNAQNAFKFAGEGIKTDFDNGKIGLSDALGQTSAAKATAVQALTAAYEGQKKVLAELQAKSIATPQDVQNVETLRRAIEALKGDLDALALIQDEIDKNNNLFGAKTDAVDLARQSGAISSRDAARQTNDLQEAQIASLAKELEALLLLDQTNTQVQEKVAETRNKIADLTNQTNSNFISFANGVNGQIGSAFSSFLDTIIEGTTSIGDAFRKLLADLLLGIAKAIAQALFLKYVLEPLGLTSGDSGGAGGFLGGLIFGKKADGGIVNGSGTGVSDTAGIFALSHGEGVIPAARVKQYGAGLINGIISGSFVPRLSIAGLAGGLPVASGIGGGRNTRIINMVDPNMIQDFMSSAQGEEIIINVIGKNPDLVQRLV